MAFGVQVGTENLRHDPDARKIGHGETGRGPRRRSSPGEMSFGVNLDLCRCSGGGLRVETVLSSKSFNLGTPVREWSPKFARYFFDLKITTRTVLNPINDHDACRKL